MKTSNFPTGSTRKSTFPIGTFWFLASLIGLLVTAKLGAAQTTVTKPAADRATNQEVTHQKVAHVIHISVDALGAKYLAKFLQEAPRDFDNFKRLIDEGASTLNARTDYSHTNTLPNHTCMITGRPVLTPAEWQECSGHFWEWNGAFPSTEAPPSLHGTNPQNSYTSSVFDVAHDHGLKTALYAGKSKFAVYTTSYGAELGAPHTNGRNKIDSAIISNGIHAKAISDLKTNRPAYAFLHYPEPDEAGHAFGYLGDEFRNSIKLVDGYLGELLAMIETDPDWKGRTAIVLSADHGGEPGTSNHGAASHPHNYTIPFIVWGSGIARGADLYALNRTTRTDPGEARVAYAPVKQPIRNGDGGNLSLKLLGLPAIPGSQINQQQDLNVW